MLFSHARHCCAVLLLALSACQLLPLFRHKPSRSLERSNGPLLPGSIWGHHITSSISRQANGQEEGSAYQVGDSRHSSLQSEALAGGYQTGWKSSWLAAADRCRAQSVTKTASRCRPCPAKPRRKAYAALRAGPRTTPHGTSESETAVPACVLALPLRVLCALARVCAIIPVNWTK